MEKPLPPSPHYTTTSSPHTPWGRYMSPCRGTYSPVCPVYTGRVSRWTPEPALEVDQVMRAMLKTLGEGPLRPQGHSQHDNPSVHTNTPSISCPVCWQRTQGLVPQHRVFACSPCLGFPYSAAGPFLRSRVWQWPYDLQSGALWSLADQGKWPNDQRNDYGGGTVSLLKRWSKVTIKILLSLSVHTDSTGRYCPL